MRYKLEFLQNLTWALAREPARKLQLVSIAGNKQQAAKQLKRVCESVASKLEMPLIKLITAHLSATKEAFEHETDIALKISPYNCTKTYCK